MLWSDAREGAPPRYYDVAPGRSLSLALRAVTGYRLRRTKKAVRAALLESESRVGLRR